MSDDGRELFDGIGYDTVDDVGYDEEGAPSPTARRRAGAPSPFPSGSAIEPCALVIFGITGDLSHRKLIPALYDLACHGVVPGEFTIVGVGRQPLDDAAMRELMLHAIDDHYGQEQADGQTCERILRAPRYVQGAFDDPETYRRLAAVLDEIDAHGGTAGNRVFYLATPPSQFPVIVRGLGDSGLARPGAWGAGSGESPAGGGTRASAAASAARRPRRGAGLDPHRHREALRPRPRQRPRAERRRARGLRREAGLPHRSLPGQGDGAEPPRPALRQHASSSRIWNRRYVDHVQITAAETLGVEHRGTYYEEAGALRDMIKPHLIQLFALVAMEPPVTFDADGDARREEQGPARRAADPRRRGRPVRGPRAVRARRARRARRAPPTARSRRSPPARPPRPTPPSSCSSTTGAGRASPSTCGPANG